MIKLEQTHFIFIFILFLNLSLLTTTETNNKKYLYSNTTTNRAETSQFELIVNQHNFSYIHNPGRKTCQQDSSQTSSSDIFLLIYVHSSPDNLKQRLAIRETWSKRSMLIKTRLLFMIGLTLNKKTQNLIDMESSLYQDIVQSDFLDSYRNLTHKAIMSMKWISIYCQNAKYILKLDDDILINPFNLIKHLNYLNKHNLIKNNSIMCLVWNGMKVQRNTKSKWYLSYDEYKQDSLGKYCSGSSYLLTNDLPMKMYNMSKYVKFFWVDDYYLTGQVAAKLNVTYIRFNSVYVIGRDLVEKRFLDHKTDYVIFGHLPKLINKYYSIWSSILNKEMFKFRRLYKKNDLIKFNYLKDFYWNSNLFSDYYTYEMN